MASAKCRAHGCRNMVALDSPYAPFCYAHIGFSSTVIASSENLMDLIPKSQLVPPSSNTPVTRFRDLLSNSTQLDSRTVESLSRAFANWNIDSDADLRIPANANKSATAARDMRELIIEEGIASDRVQILKVSGLNRVVPNTSIVQQAKGFTHEVVLIDANGKNPVVVDPSITTMAPVHDPNQEVDDQLISGSTPFGDVPWAGARSDYEAGEYLWWDSSAVVA